MRFVVVYGTGLLPVQRCTEWLDVGTPRRTASVHHRLGPGERQSGVGTGRYTELYSVVGRLAVGVWCLLS